MTIRCKGHFLAPRTIDVTGFRRLVIVVWQASAICIQRSIALRKFLISLPCSCPRDARPTSVVVGWSDHCHALGVGSEGIVGDKRSTRLKISDSFIVQSLKRSISTLRRDKKLKLKSRNLWRFVKLCKTIHLRLVLLYRERQNLSQQIPYFKECIWWQWSLSYPYRAFCKELGACRSWNRFQKIEA